MSVLKQNYLKERQAHDATKEELKKAQADLKKANKKIKELSTKD